MDINLLFLILFLVCLGLSAFFCSAETAFIGMQKLRLQHLIQSGHPEAKRVAKILQHPERFLATVLLGINLTETAVATLGTLIAASLWGEKLGAALAIILITVITLIFAEFLPKSIAARYGEKIALRYVTPIEFISLVFYPFVYVLNHIGIRLTKLVGPEIEPRPTVSEEEIRTAISLGEKEGVVEETEADMLHKVFEFGDRPVREVMIPRTDIIWVEQGTKLADFLSIYAQHPHSRFPVYEGNFDNVTGMVFIKDVLLAQAQDSLGKESPVTELARPVYFVPEPKRISELFTEMQAGGYQVAVIADEYGGTAGIVTLNQLVEEIVGELRDELAKSSKEFETIDSATSQVDGSMRVEEANEQLGLELPLGEYETVAGFILSLLGHIPKEGAQIRYHKLKLVVTGMRGRKIEKVLVTKEL
jgi:putative hemolysin